ncbi:PilZ domain-containing protein [Novosphingobium lindaniclasticum]
MESHELPQDEPSPCNLTAYGRRRQSRLHVRLPARLVTLGSTHQAVLLDLSASGARLHVQAQLRTGCEVVVEWAKRHILGHDAPGHEGFGEVIWCRSNHCGIAFFEPLPLQIVLATRLVDDCEHLPPATHAPRKMAV